MATRKDKNTPAKGPFGDISKDNPRMVERVSDGARARVTDPLEFVSLTTAHGYRDVTDSAGSKSKTSGSSNAGSGSGNTPAADNTTSK